MLISVVMPTYNHEKFIREAVDSVLLQTWSELELIIVDDGSDFDIHARLSSIKDPRMCVLQAGGKGPSAAINIGIGHATGQQIALFSGDDICFPERLENQANALGKSTSTLLFSVPSIVDSRGIAFTSPLQPVFQRGRDYVNQEDFIHGFFYSSNCICAPSAFGSRLIFDRIGQFKPSLWQLQDFDYWIRALKNHISIKVNSQKTLKYRQRDDGENLSGPQSTQKAMFELGTIYKSFFDGFDHSSLISAFRKETFANFDTCDDTVYVNTPFWMLCHSSNQVKQLGYNVLIERDSDPEWNVYLNKMRLSGASFAHFTSQAASHKAQAL